MVFKHLQAFSFAQKGQKINKNQQKSTDARKIIIRTNQPNKNISVILVNAVALVSHQKLKNLHLITLEYTTIYEAKTAQARAGQAQRDRGRCVGTSRHRIYISYR